ncbi:hypothetical protein B296_00044856 [Ensete ventricosum]|uniref:RRM domain-containing protein n=1 Tax=Ensete ventricosum TaxID=4639 RepID=A0A426Y6G0_ENSVE|nr:hypothetical protein B296_00044856 [Ensete ventricosum]
MSEPEEYCCFIGSLSGTTTDGGLKEAFQKFGHLTKAKVARNIILHFLFLDHAKSVCFSYSHCITFSLVIGCLLKISVAIRIM